MLYCTGCPEKMSHEIQFSGNIQKKIDISFLPARILHGKLVGCVHSLLKRPFVVTHVSTHTRDDGHCGCLLAAGAVFGDRAVFLVLVCVYAHHEGIAFIQAKKAFPIFPFSRQSMRINTCHCALLIREERGGGADEAKQVRVCYFAPCTI